MGRVDNTTGLLLSAGIIFGLLGCTGTLSEPGEPDRRRGSGTTSDSCETTLDAPLRRLTAGQYRASVARLLPGVDLSSLQLLTPSMRGAFDNDVRSQGVTTEVVDAYAVAAEQLSAIDLMGEDLSEITWLSCDLATDTECAPRALAAFAEAAFRRPLSDGEGVRYQDFVTSQSAEFGGSGALAMGIEAVLQSPSFLYLPETGDSDAETPEGTLALSAHEFATRLSLFLWNEPPDEELLAAAAAGILATEAGLQIQIDRMLDDPKSERMLDGFVSQWLRLTDIDESDLDTSAYPEIGDSQVRTELQQSVLSFVRHIYEGSEGGGLRGLFTSRTAFVNDRLAPLFGVAAPGSDELVEVQLPETERAGLLTQPGVLASTSHGAGHSPVLRGVTVLEQILCSSPGAPPASVVDGTDDGDDSIPLTTRQRFEDSHGSALCASCHEDIDGIGFTFERYDALGRYRLTENDIEVNPQGVLRGQPVADAVALGEELGSDELAAECFAQQWVRFAFGRPRTDGDACLIEELGDALSAGGSLRDVIRSIALSDAFRLRPEVQP